MQANRFEPKHRPLNIYFSKLASQFQNLSARVSFDAVIQILNQ